MMACCSALLTAIWAFIGGFIKNSELVIGSGKYFLTYSSNSNLPSETPPQEVETGQVDGGTVYHLGQIHLARGVRDYEAHVVIGRHRAAVLKKLGTLPVYACFLEGEDQTFNSSINYIPSEHQQFMLRTIFPTRQIPERITDEQAILFAGGDLATIIPHFYPHISLYGAESIEERNYIDMCSRAERKAREFNLFERRERFAILQMQKLFAKLAPEKRAIAIIYGARHTFAFSTVTTSPDAKRPRVIKHTFESILPHERARAFLRAASAEEQLKVIMSPGRINLGVWAKALSVDVQLELLPRIRAGVDEVYCSEVLRDRLLAGMTVGSREELVAAILKAYKRGEGPFADLRLRSGGEYFKDRVKLGELSYITSELHPFTQLELLRVAESITVDIWQNLRSQVAQIEGLKKIPARKLKYPKILLEQMLFYSSNEVVEAAVFEAFDSHSAPFFTI